MKIRKKGLLILISLLLSMLIPLFNNEAKINDNFVLEISPQALSLYKKWDFDPQGDVVSSPASADINGDGYLEVIIVSGSGNIYCVNHTGDLVWSYVSSGSGVPSPVIADLNKDGFSEIIFESSYDELICLNHTGGLVWSFDTGYDFVSSPVLADLNNDSLLEILIGSGNNLFCLYQNGSVNWIYNLITDYFWGISVPSASPAIGDLDGDKSLEIVFSGHDKFYCINASGFLVWDYVIERGTSPAIADLDGDGKLEIVFGADTDQDVICLDNEGSLNWSYSLGSGVVSSPTIGDLDDDGTFEIIIGSTSMYLYCLNHLGISEWIFTSRNPDEQFLASPSIADLNNNSNLEVIICSYSYDDHFSYVYCINNVGNEIASFDESLIFFKYSSASIVDLDLDGISEILIGSGQNFYCLGLSGITSSGSQQWYCYRGSIFHTGQMDSDSDYLDDETEEFYTTDAHNPDTDKDGLSDYLELFFYPTNHLNNDTDIDKLNDGEEILNYFTDPMNNDSDTDGLLDGIEVLTYNSNPNDNDTDFDRVDDFSEIFVYGTNITNSDSDLDGLLDGEELFTYSTDPLLTDTDFDGYSDFLEISEGTNPLDPNDHPPTTVTPPPVTVTPPPETITVPETITQNNTITTTVEAGIIMVTSVVSFVTVLTIVVIIIRKKRK